MTMRWGQAAKVLQCTPHRFRHTVATRLLEEGVDIRIIREILAHADINDTMLYTKVANPQIASAMLRLPADWSVPPARL
jgi:integrase/recombinase XerD